MSLRFAFWSRLVASAAVLFVALLAGPALAQRDEGEVALDKLARLTREMRTALLKGERTASSSDKEHKQAIEVAVRSVLEPFTWRRIQNDPGQIEKYFSVLENNLDTLAKYKPATDNAARMYTRQVIERANKLVVVDKSKPIVAMNATRALAALIERSGKQTEAAWVASVLPRLDGGNAELLATTLTGYVAKPRNDAVRYWAVRGLRDLLALPPDKDKNPLQGKAAQEKAVVELIRFAERPVKFPAAARRSEIEGYKFARREAVRALAGFRSPRLGDKAFPALTLARFAGNDARIVPDPRIDERLEAAIGLARLLPDPKGKDDYQPDYAAHQIARCAADFVGEANKDSGKKASARRRPWKVGAARLNDALDVLKGLKNAHAAKVVDKVLPVLANVEKGNVGDAAGLADWLANNPPPSKGLFKDSADSTVKERTASAEEE
jgi:hypothetical protein